jgi:hypothetical protein
MTSLMIHLVAASIVAVYLVTQAQQFQDLVGLEMLQPQEPPKPQVRKPIIKPVVRPEVPLTNAIAIEQVQPQQRATNVSTVRIASVRPQAVTGFAGKVVRPDAPLRADVPKVVEPDAPMPEVVTHANLPIADAPDALAFSSPVVGGSGGGGGGMGEGGGVSRGMGGVVQVRATTAERPPGLAMVEHVGAARDALAEVVEKVLLGNVEIPPLLRGEPGGRVVGKGRDIHGIFRFTRVRHSLSDWWADASALNAFAKWMNEKTHIKTDMNVEGGALKLTDASLMKSPMLIMTGHDPALVRQKNLLGRQYGGGKLDDHLSEYEAIALRRYLVEKGGFMLFDDCGLNDPDRGMTRLFLSQMRFIMPEYHVERIPNDHEIYNNFYNLGGPPIGFDIYWASVAYGRRPSVPRNYLEGITIGDKIAVLVSRRDFMCSMEAVSLPSREVHYSPSAYRLMTNLAVYALTHGLISDYSGYVPEDKLEAQRFPTRAPEASRIGAVK